MINHSHDTCKEFSQITPATQQDNYEILKFLENVSMALKEGNLDFSRAPDFFKLNKLQGIASSTFLFRNRDGLLVGIGVITAVKGNYHGKEIVWAYASELRFSPEMDRHTKSQFRPWFSFLVKNSKLLEDLHCPEYILSIVLDDNEVAKKALLNKNNPVLYRPVHQYKTRAIIGKIPSIKRSNNKVLFSTEADKEEIISLIRGLQNKSAFSYSFEDLEHKMNLLNHGWNDFLIARDNKNKILGIVLLTTDNLFRRPQLKFDNKSQLKKVSLLLKFLGRPLIESDSKINTTTLAFMTLAPGLNQKQKEQVIVDLVRKAWDERCSGKGPNKHHAVILSEEGNAKHDFLKHGFLTQKIPGTVYQLIHRDNYKKQNLIRGLANKKVVIETSFL